MARKLTVKGRERVNEKYKHISLERETSSHQPLLLEFVQATTGPILEVGSGLYSTPFLHWLCIKEKRQLTTVEAYPHYLEFAKKFETEWHKVICEKELENIKGTFSVVFIDHTPKRPRTRGSDALLFADRADYVVLHDAGPESLSKYEYEKAYAGFKYRRDWTLDQPTTVLSNFHPL